MNFQFGGSWQEYEMQKLKEFQAYCAERKTIESWHYWFAWRPVILDTDWSISWLENVERRGHYRNPTSNPKNEFYVWEYRKIA
ncbi:MAG: hypothetical protein ACR2QC_04140 [Gammaproteobacteria bacterium]